MSSFVPAAAPTTAAGAMSSLLFANNIRELVAMLPITYQAPFRPLLEDLCRKGQRAADSFRGLRVLEKHQEDGTLPAHLSSLRPMSLQVAKEFQGHANLRELQENINKEHATYVARVLENEVLAKRGEYHLLISQVYPFTYSGKVTALCDKMDRDLVALHIPDERITTDVAEYWCRVAVVLGESISAVKKHKKAKGLSSSTREPPTSSQNGNDPTLMIVESLERVVKHLEGLSPQGTLSPLTDSGTLSNFGK